MESVLEFSIPAYPPILFAIYGKTDAAGAGGERYRSIL